MNQKPRIQELHPLVDYEAQSGICHHADTAQTAAFTPFGHCGAKFSATTPKLFPCENQPVLVQWNAIPVLDRCPKTLYILTFPRPQCSSSQWGKPSATSGRSPHARSLVLSIVCSRCLLPAWKRLVRLRTNGGCSA